MVRSTWPPTAMAGRTQNDSYDAHLTDLKNDLNALQRDMRQLIDKVGMSAGDAANGARGTWSGERKVATRAVE